MEAGETLQRRMSESQEELGWGRIQAQLWGSRDQSLSCSSAPPARKGSFPNLSPNSCSPGPIERDPGIFPGWGLSLGRCFLPCLRSPG